MRLLDQIVDILNEHLQDDVLTGQLSQDAAFHGLAYISGEREGSKQKPYTWNGQNIIDLTIDDTLPFTIYHRCTNIDLKSGLPSFGDGNGQVDMIASMMAVVYADRFDVDLTQEDLILLIASGLSYTIPRAELTGSGLKSVKASVQRANNNSVSVFQGEYGQTANYRLQPSSVYFSVQYQIEISADASCLTCQNC